MKKIEYDYGRHVSSIETPVKVSGPQGGRIVNACWDTGSTHTTITNRLAEELGMVSQGTLHGYSVGSAMSYRKYKAKVDLGNGIFFTGVILGTDSISAGQNIGLLIGMDIISNGDMIVENRKGKTLFSFLVD